MPGRLRLDAGYGKARTIGNSKGNKKKYSGDGKGSVLAKKQEKQTTRKLNPETNIWETSRPVLEKWLRETKDPINNFTETLKDSAEVIKKLPELPQMMEKANQALTFLASGQIPQNTNSYSAMKNKELEMKSFRNQSIIGLLLLVFIGFMVF